MTGEKPSRKELAKAGCPGDQKGMAAANEANKNHRPTYTTESFRLQGTIDYALFFCFQDRSSHFYSPRISTLPIGPFARRSNANSN